MLIRMLLFLGLALIFTSKAEESSILENAEITNPDSYFNWEDRGSAKSQFLDGFKTILLTNL